ncbi:MAG: hypothetical protein PHO06_03115 [Clostridia bacterium]|nr:hypothetical protein [Clostridia bacterium]
MILNEIQRFLHSLFNSIDDDLIFIVGISFQILLTIFFIIKSHFSYEMRVVRKLAKLNSWLNQNEYIDSNNLLAFNDLMKTTPKLLRYYWHQYMLYREKEPSFYMSPYNCIEKPLKTSSYRTNIKNYTLMSFILAIIIFIFGVAGLGTFEFQFVYLAKTMFTPIAVILLNMIFVIILRARENRNLNALYQYFYYFNRFIDKAVSTMPAYVDFEVLFTRKEIKQGIPVLNEYLERRERQEQEELEKARMYAVEHEAYDFSDAGLSGSLVLDRAMKETETYLNIRQRLRSEIEQFESEVESLKRNYENTQKDYEKRMQASKENIARLKTQQEESTNRIETNYIKKQQSDEIKKQEQFERDHESSTVRFNQEMEVILAEIETRKKDLEERRAYVEEAMKAEYQTFSLKLYNNIVEMIEEKNQQEKDVLTEIKDDIAEQLDGAMVCINDKNQEIQYLRDILKKHKIKVAGYAGFHSKKLQTEAKKLRRLNKKKGKADDTDDGFSLEFANYDENFDIDEQDIRSEQSENQNYQSVKNSESSEIESGESLNKETQSSQVEQKIEQAENKDDSDDDEKKKTLKSNENINEKSQILKDNLDKFDSENNRNSTNENNDSDGNVEQNLKQESQQSEIKQEIEKTKQQAGQDFKVEYKNEQKVESSSEPKQIEVDGEYKEEPDGIFDEDGNFRYESGAYYDARGFYHDEHGGWYDSKLNYHKEGEPGDTEEKNDSAGEEMKKIPLDENVISLQPDDWDEEPISKATSTTNTTQSAETQNANRPEIIENVDGVNVLMPFDDEEEEEQQSATVEEIIKQYSSAYNIEPEKASDSAGQEKDDNLNKRLKKELDNDFGFSQLSKSAEKQTKTQKIEEEKVETIEQKEPKEKTESGIDGESARVEETTGSAGGERERVETTADRNDEVKEKEKPETEKSGTEPGRRPGRPRKVVDTDAEPKPKRRPGRPRKAVDADAEPKPKRRPGRPRKVVDADAEPKPKRRPGRPRKSETVNKEASNNEKDDECDEKLDDIDALNQKIAKENEKLKKQQGELKDQLDEAISIIDDDKEE